MAPEGLHVPCRPEATMLLADVHLSDLIWTTIWVFFLVMFIWVFIAVVSDLFRDHTLSGWAKAMWIVGLIVVPVLGSLVYLIARGQGMAQRQLERHQMAQAQFDDYVRTTVGSSGSTGSSSVDDLSRLAEMHSRGVINDAEFEAMKARIVGGTSTAP
jgi:hypothetical protein